MFKLKKKTKGLALKLLLNQNLKIIFHTREKKTAYLFKHSSVTGTWRRSRYLLCLANKNS